MLCVRFVCLALLLVAGQQGIKGQEEWDYNFRGNDWNGTCRTGENQSPININTKWTSSRDVTIPLRFTNYDQAIPVRAIQDHHTIEVYPQDNRRRPSISGGGLLGSYTLQQAHFHWRSEHTINNQRFAMEAHLVHFRDIYGNRSDAAQNDPFGIAVLGVLFCEGQKSFNMEKVIESLTQQTTVNLRFKDFLPVDLDFYRYHGSLTTPPCTESVIWTLFKNRVTLSKDQLSRIRNSFPPGTPDNYRQLQDLNHRPVERWGNKGFGNKVGGLKSSANLLVAAPLFARNGFF